jgi:hypothetical protein
MTVHRLLYRSDAALVGSGEAVEREVAAIVAAAALANAAAGMTGALALSSGAFVQVLEGPPAAVEATFERICRDLRHRRVRLLEFAAAEERAFAEWTMARVRSTVDVARLCPGIHASEHAKLDAGAAGAAVQVMRALLLTEASPVRGGAPQAASA